MRATPTSAVRRRNGAKKTARPTLHTDAAAKPSSTGTSATAPTKRVLNSFLVVVYRHAMTVEHATPMPIRAIEEELKLSEHLAKKVAEFLETEGLIDYDDQALDITIPGMIRAEEILATMFEQQQQQQQQRAKKD